MPNIKTLVKSMRERNISEDKINQIVCVDKDTCTPEEIVSVIEKMDLYLTPEECLSIMEQEGCCKSGKRDKDCKKCAKEIKDKTLSEKLQEISTIQYMGSPRLNEDGTITTGIYWSDNESYHCACPTVKKLKGKATISPTYCGCCAGHFMYHYQNILGVKLKLKKIVSSPLNSNGKMPCEFIYEIIEF